MKEIPLVLVVILVTASGFLIRVPTTPTVQRPIQVIGGSVLQQKLILPLFDNVCELSRDPVISRLAQEFSWDLPNEEFWKPEVLSTLQKLTSSKGHLGKGEIFSEYIPEHFIELKAVYDVLSQAKTFDTLYKVAAWSRQNLNCGLFVSVMYMAVQNRDDTRGLALPAPYEILPNYFIRKDIIVQAATLLAGEEIAPSESIHNEGNVYTIDTNYTDIFYDNDGDSKLVYFREDIGLNTYYFLRKLKLTSLFNGSDTNNRCGENIYQMMKQFMARYNLERYANALPELEGTSWQDMSDISYDPMLIYSDGNEFSHRVSPVELKNNEDIALLETIENNIGIVVSHMRQSGYNKTQILNHLMEILVIGDRSYETLARRLLGKDLTNNGSPSVLEHYMTSLRDPVFWNLNQRIVNIVDDALKILSYERNELYFPGVEVVNVEVKKMMTLFDYFQFDVTNALKIDNASTTFQVNIGQPRLNHKPFTIKLNVSSSVAERGLVKIYLGPKMMPGELTKRKNMFVLMDVFDINLKLGANIITRTSDQMKQFAQDFMSFGTLYKKVEDAEFGVDSLPINIIESQSGYPSRFILPKGLPQGLPLQIFVFIAPFVKKSVGALYAISSEFNNAVMSPGYPLDLDIEDGQLFELSNAFIKDVVVTHKGDNKIENYGESGVAKKWYSTYEAGSNTGYSRPEPFDYNSKKNQYINKENDIVLSENKYDITRKYDIGDYNSVASEQELQNDQNRKLYNSNYNYAATRQEPFDYNAKRGQYTKTNDYLNKRKFDYTKFQSDVTKNEDKFTSLNENEKINEKNIKSGEQEMDETDKIVEIMEPPKLLEPEEPRTLKLRMPKNRSTVYDFIVQALKDDDSVENTYE